MRIQKLSICPMMVSSSATDTPCPSLSPDMDMPFLMGDGGTRPDFAGEAELPVAGFDLSETKQV